MLGHDLQIRVDAFGLSSQIWTASSPRDITTSKAWIHGAFPPSQRGPNDSGDGTYVTLIEVPNKSKDWAGSLTPHKVCDRFEKESSLEPAKEWLRVYAKDIRERLAEEIGAGLDFSDQDVLAMQMVSGENPGGFQEDADPHL